MKRSSAKLPSLPAEIVESITPETHFKLATHFNNTPDPGSCIQPGERSYTVTIGGKTYAATEDQVGEISERKGLLAQSKAFLAENFPDLFGKAQA